MKFINELITASNLFFIFLTPVVIILSKKNLGKKTKVFIPILFCLLISGSYLFEAAQNKKEYNPYENFLNEIKNKSKLYTKDIHTKAATPLYERKFNQERIDVKELNKIFLLGADEFGDRSQILRFLDLYSKLLIKSPLTCQYFANKRQFFNKYFFENLSKLDATEKDELIRIITETIFYSLVLQTKKKESGQEESAEKAYEKRIEENEKELNSSETESTLLNTDQISERCRKIIIQFTNISGEDMYTQDRYLNQIKREAWEALKDID